MYQARWNKLEWPYTIARIVELSRHYNGALVLIDSTGVGEPVYEDLVRRGVPIEPFHFTNQSKKQLIEKLANWIEIGQITMLNIVETMKEFTNFTYDISEVSGKVRYNAPVGFHDDIVISHSLAIWSLSPIYKTASDKPMGRIQAFRKIKESSYAEEEQNWKDFEAI